MQFANERGQAFIHLFPGDAKVRAATFICLFTNVLLVTKQSLIHSRY